MNAWKVIVSTLVIFIAGVVTGGLLVTHTVRVFHGDARPAMNRNPLAPGNPISPWQIKNKDLLRRMDRDLDLTPEQHARIERIMAASAERTKALWKPIAPLMNKETQLARAEILEELTSEQRKKFEGFAKFHSGLDKRRNGTNSPLSTPGTNAVGTNAVSTNATPASQQP